jgi:hypothetical protein
LVPTNTNEKQMDEAREIMEKVWETNELWENIVKDEFIG